MGVQWTEEQRQVIELGGRNILVSAAAGSGKTAVLVERIITMLTRKENPVDVDRLLIVTFTEAAAAEMKERIRQAIEDQAEKRPEDANLNRQATLIHSAQITTIHSFCLSVIREHFHTIDLDPAFRIGEEGELKLLRGDVMQEMLEQYYEEADPEFLNLVESYGGSRDDKKIEELIERLYEFSRSYPEPDRWLAECVHAYEVENMEELQATVYYQAMQKNMVGYMAGAKELLQQGLAVCMAPDGPQMYMDALEDDLRIADDRPVGVLRVRAPHAFGQQQLLAPLVAFLQRHPQLSVEWMLNDNTVDFLSDNIDCAIRVGAEVDPATVSVLLAEVPRCVVASPELLAKYPPLTSLEALSGLPWIAINTFYQHEVRLRHQASGQIVSTAITPCLSTDSLYVARNTALAGLGVAMVSSWTVVEDIAAGRLIELFPQWRPASLPVHLVYPWARYYPTRLRKFLDLMREIMPDLAGMQRPQSA